MRLRPRIVSELGKSRQVWGFLRREQTAKTIESADSLILTRPAFTDRFLDVVWAD